MFLVKKIVSRFLFPVPLSLEFMLAGLFLLWFTRRQRAGKALVTLGPLLLLGFSNAWTSNGLLVPLESRYPALSNTEVRSLASQVHFIAVLGGWADDDPNVPITSHISPDLMVRLIQGISLQRQLPGSKLILSGGRESAVGMARVAEALGVRALDLQLLSQPLDTEEESRQLAPIVGSRQFVLVTSASHMPRAVGLCRKKGLRPVPAPTDYLAPRHGLEIDDLFPDGSKLLKSQVAIYEYLGWAWETVRGKM